MAASNPLDVLDQLNRLEALKARSEEDSRRHERFAIRGSAELHAVHPGQLDDPSLEVNLRDIGFGGVGFVGPRPLAVGSSWRIAFLHRGYIIAQHSVMIRHCRQVGSDLFLIGAQFCISPGLLSLLGVDPHTAEQSDGAGRCGQGQFLSPDDMP